MSNKNNNKSRRNNNSNRRNPKGRPNSSNREESSAKVNSTQNCDTTTQSFKSGKTNDVMWYAANPELLKAAASFPMSTSTGEEIPATDLNSVPGVMAIYWDPIVGSGDALNEAAAQTYSFVVHANSRNKSYNQADLMLMILAGANVFSALATGIRAYGVMHNFVQENLYTPEALVQAMGFNYADLKDHLSDMWFDLNEMISRISSIWVPNKFYLIQRWFWMNSNIYKDDTLTKSQMYLFVQDHMYIYDEKTSSTGGMLKICDLWGSTKANVAAGTFRTWDQYKTAVNEMIYALLNSEDRGIMYGDIMKAYGAENLYSMSPITVDYRVIPQYDQEVLTQIENSVATDAIFGGLQSFPDGSIGKKWEEVNIDGKFHLPPERKILNFHQLADPNPADIMVATRLMYGRTRVALREPSKQTALIELYDCGSEIVTGYDVVYMKWRDGVPTVTHRMMHNGTTDPGNTGISQWYAFDWAPWMYSYSNTPAFKTGDYVFAEVNNWYGDFGNYTFLDYPQVHKLNVTAVKSELGIESRP